MPNLSEHQSSTATKLLLIGDSGSGKTGSLASLAKAGLSLRILDFDNGLDILANMLGDDSANVEFETCTDEYKNVGGKPSLAKAQAFGKALQLLDKWHGGVVTWDSSHVLVIDSMTFMSRAAMNYVLALNGRPGGPPQLQDWGAAMNLVENVLAMLYSDSVKCNVIVTSHISYVEDETGIVAGYPSALGQKLPPKIGR